jgi:hypothetical protein
MTTATATAPGAPAPEAALTALEPCDAHAATTIPAMVRLAHHGRTLDLCKHDYETHAAVLADAGWTVTDDRRHTLA